ncbi:hypothetical protein OAL45_00850 [bacterium]|nr:hypothetical protein [bacterium]MDC0317984.1 hypothetical protein [bacterium]
MSHISGDFNYSFVRLDPSWDNSLQTGVNSLVIGLNCTFTGVDSHDTSVTESQYVDGSTGWTESITYDYLTGNLTDICNTYASGQGWWENLKNSVSGRIDHPVVISDFPFPVSGDPIPEPPHGHEDVIF